MDPIIIPVAAWTQERFSRPAGKLRLQAFLALALGILLLSCAAVAAYAASRGRWEMLGGVAVLGLVGFVMTRQGLHRLRITRGMSASDVVSLGAPHAFQISDTEVVFPALPSIPEEHWPLASVTAACQTTMGQDFLVLSSPSRRTRRFPARGLGLPVAEVVAIVRSRQQR